MIAIFKNAFKAPNMGKSLLSISQSIKQKKTS